MTSLHGFLAPAARKVGGASLLLLGLGSIGACGSDETAGPAFVHPTEQSFCRAAAEAECNDAVVGACYGSDAASLEADRQKCVASRSVSAVCNPRGLPYRPNEAEACVAARGEVWADAVLSREEVESVREACLAVFTRGQAAGSSCQIDEDCDGSGGLRCVAKPGAPSGVCAVPVEMGGGVDCSAPEARCAEGFFCDEGAGACLQKLGAGKACSPARLCQDDLRCTPESEAEDAPTICQPKFDNGSACEADEECTGGFCIQTTSGKACAARFALAFGSGTCESFQ